MNTFRYAWRNLWRNGKRTAVTLAAVGLNTAILIVTYALMDGILIQTVRNATGLAVGEVQAHAPGYLEDYSLYESIENPHEILEAAREGGVLAAPRLYGYGLVAHGTKSAGAFFWGVDPDTERRAFRLAEQTQEGDFLANDADRGLVLGKKLARSLQADVGAEIVVVVQAADGSLGNELFKVAGILKTAGDAIDRSAAILHESDFRELFVLPEAIHELAITSKGKQDPAELSRKMAASAPEAEFKTWAELLPMLADMTKVTKVSMLIFGSIFFIAAGLGVTNTMLMATYERIHEFGVLKALGATPWRIILDVTAEALLLSVLATVMGVAVGLAGGYYLQVAGLDTSSFAGDITIVGVVFDPVWRAALSAEAVVIPVLIMWGICLAASLYPACIAARLDPVKAIQHV